MNLFDAINHALTTVPTGGYSTHDASFGYFQNPSLETAATLFMFMGGVPFILYIKLVFQGKFSFQDDDQFKVLTAMVLVLIAIMGFWVWQNTGNNPADSLRMAAFHVVSIITTTGYASGDYTLWGSFAVTFFFFLTYIGASTGSTAGGLKTMRIIVSLKAFRKQVNKLILPHRVVTEKFQDKPLDLNIENKVLGFLALYIAANALFTLLLLFSGLDFATSISGAATSLANVGPGIGNVIGPSGNFSSLPDIPKWILCAGMLLGRLEIFTVIVLFTPAYWKS
jgi:trk system potassium uptake protein TrkH